MATEIVFLGHQQPDGLKVYADRDGARWVVDPRLDLRRHSPTGFQCGYSGSGPAQLALAILAYFYNHHYNEEPGGEERAILEYHEFKSRVIACIPTEWRTWSLRFMDDKWVLEGPDGHGRIFGKATPPEHPKNVWDRLIEE